MLCYIILYHVGPGPRVRCAQRGSAPAPFAAEARHGRASTYRTGRSAAAYKPTARPLQRAPSTAGDMSDPRTQAGPKRAYRAAALRCDGAVVIGGCARAAHGRVETRRSAAPRPCARPRLGATAASPARGPTCAPARAPQAMSDPRTEVLAGLKRVVGFGPGQQAVVHRPRYLVLLCIYIYIYYITYIHIISCAWWASHRAGRPSCTARGGLQRVALRHAVCTRQTSLLSIPRERGGGILRRRKEAVTPRSQTLLGSARPAASAFLEISVEAGGSCAAGMGLYRVRLRGMSYALLRMVYKHMVYKHVRCRHRCTR
jgi:hypothetical protein